MNEKLKPYAEFLEATAEKLVEYQPQKVVLCAILPEGEVMTAYLGDVGPQSKALMAHSIECDSIMDVMRANAGEIIRAAEEQEGDDNA